MLTSLLFAAKAVEHQVERTVASRPEAHTASIQKLSSTKTVPKRAESQVNLATFNKYSAKGFKKNSQFFGRQLQDSTLLSTQRYKANENNAAPEKVALAEGLLGHLIFQAWQPPQTKQNVSNTILPFEVLENNIVVAQAYDPQKFISINLPVDFNGVQPSGAYIPPPTWKPEQYVSAIVPRPALIDGLQWLKSIVKTALWPFAI